MKSLARIHVRWLSLDKAIESMCKSCRACQEVKPSPPTAPLQNDHGHPNHGNEFMCMLQVHFKAACSFCQWTPIPNGQRYIVYFLLPRLRKLGKVLYYMSFSFSLCLIMEAYLHLKSLHSFVSRMEFDTSILPLIIPFQMEQLNS